MCLFQMFVEYGFHPRVQRWVIAQSLCSDGRSLASYGIYRDGDTAFLYLLSARHACLDHQQDQENSLPMLTAAPPPPNTSLAHTPTSSSPSSHDWRGYSTLPPRFSHSSTGERGSRTFVWQGPKLRFCYTRPKASELTTFTCPIYF